MIDIQTPNHQNSDTFTAQATALASKLDETERTLLSSVEEMGRSETGARALRFRHCSPTMCANCRLSAGCEVA